VYLLPLPVNPLATPVQCTQLKTDFKKGMSPQEQNLMHARDKQRKDSLQTIVDPALENKGCKYLQKAKNINSSNGPCNPKKKSNLISAAVSIWRWLKVP
jgi:hypothetical protein